jgi:hypothetical protein
MKRKYSNIGLMLLCFLFWVAAANAGFIKQIQVGNYWTWVDDMTAAGETNTGDRGGMYQNAHWMGWPACAVQNSGWYIGTPNWTDEKGTVWPVKLSGAAPVTYNEQQCTMPVADKDGFYIRRYRRYQPPTITVDGKAVQDPFPLEGDAVAPDKIPGTADIMVTSTINTDMGVTVEQKVFAWSQKNHDDYIVFSYTFTNTGNTDLDPEIELPNQTLNNWYFLRASRLERWDSEFWYSSRGELTTDTLRMQFAYPGRRRDAGIIDNTGNTFWAPQPGWMWNAESMGQAVLHVDKSPADHSDDFNQPAMTATENSDLLWIRNDPTSTGPADWAQVYKVMSEGWSWRGFVPDATGANVRPGHHGVRMDENGVTAGARYILNFPWVTYGGSYFWAAGPYTLKPGESITVVWADGYGNINPLKIWEVQTAWENKTATPPPGMTFDNAAGVGLIDNMPPTYKAFPELYNKDYNDWAKDCWVFTGIDSLMQNMNNAQWNEHHDFMAPAAPQPPSLAVQSLPNKIAINWGSESESASDFAGYKLYRSKGMRYEGHIPWTVTKDHGEWKLLKDFPGSGTHDYDDTDVTRGVAYYYTVTAYDDGVSNAVDANGKKESLESGFYMNMTTSPAHLTRGGGTSLEDIVVVPNPYNLGAKELQYPGEPNKIMFLELPPVCTIKIYTESGDLIKTIEHTSGSGDEAWGETALAHMTSEIGQIVVSGIYIANFKTPDGASINRKFVIIR